ncbi:DUF1638 domain-containing protein [Methanococcoides alaskense]|uniref:DUF1638 domain-containing protein n=1 Tax=Methanococcoides alaskense TaxID=325778 RepID=A0AA90TZB6_9EURY|nr:DUF1638 domain-containing protein [Methanococcoides alaskense]MDA0525720.1 DUF1638 domain-containing protein [Methanococcoides alaskense]MDR6222946.1 hypothetical protein [Methanococcoides alaskense]
MVALDRLPSLISEIERTIIPEFKLLLSRIPFLRKMHYKTLKKNKQQITVVVNLLTKTLHADTDKLHSEVCRNVREMAEFSDGILLFYGKCGYNSEKMEAELKDFDCPLYFLKDENRELADDCISIALGGNEIYTKTMLIGNGKASMYATPMWMSSFREELDRPTVPSQNLNKYLSNPRYGQVFKINTQGFKYNGFHKSVSEFAKAFDMNIIEIDGSMKIAVDSYMDAKVGVYKNVE